jgi:hypothetical protein
MRKIYVLILAAVLFSFRAFDASTFALSGGSFTQNWANTGLIPSMITGLVFQAYRVF